MRVTIASAILGLAASTAAFVAKPSARTPTQLHETKADLVELAKKCNPVIGFYDPINLSEAEFWGMSNEATIGFIRHAEIKHGRVAMFAFVGYIAHANGFKFPWAMQMDGTPFPSETNPPVLWDTISNDAKWQIIGLIGFLEYWSELSTPNNKHYMKGGRPGDYPDFEYSLDGTGLPHPAPFNFYDPFRKSVNMSEEKKQSRLVAEINNGRLAMLGIMGFLAAQTVPGSVPVLTGIVQPYDGEVMAPFKTAIWG